MKSDIKNAAAFLAVAIWADGVYAAEEKEVLAEIAEALEVNAGELTEKVEESLKELEEKDDEGNERELEKAVADTPGNGDHGFCE